MFYQREKRSKYGITYLIFKKKKKFLPHLCVSVTGGYEILVFRKFSISTKRSSSVNAKRKYKKLRPYL